VEDSDEDKDSGDEETKFGEYEGRRNQLVPKEFAYAIIDKMKENTSLDLYDQERLLEFRHKDQDFVEAYDQVLQQYIDQDKLNLLPAFFKQNQMVKQIKEQRRTMRFEYPQVHPSGSAEAQENFVHALDQVMVGNQLNRVISLVRFQNFDLYKVLIELIKRMDIYKLKLVITYVNTYLDEFLVLCDKKAQIDPKLISFKDEFDPEMQERKKETYDVEVSNQIFYLKIGQHP